MNYFKQLLCGTFSESLKGSTPENHPCVTANDGDADDDVTKNVEINEAKTNKSDQKTDCMEILDSSLVTSDSSDVVSNYLADSTENLTLDDVSTEISDSKTVNNKESSNKPGNNSKEYIKESEKYAEHSSNVNVFNISDEDVKMNIFNDNNNLLNENAVAELNRSMSINENEDLIEVQDNAMDFDDISKDTNHNTENIMLQNEELHTIQQITEVDTNNNNTDILTQFIENNIVDFVQTPRNISEILSSLIEFDITSNNSFVNFATDNNDVNNYNDDYVLMDLDAIVDEIESIDSYINEKPNSHNTGVLNVITPQDIDNLLNENLNDSISSPVSTIAADAICAKDVPLEKIELQDFEQQIDLIRSSSALIDKREIPATNYDFNIEIDVETVLSQHSDYLSEEAKSNIMLTDSKSNSFVNNENKLATEKQLDNTAADQNSKDTYVYTSANKKTEVIHIETNKKTINKHNNVKTIETITISSSDDEENYPLALLKKRKSITIKRTQIASDHISISSNESNTDNKDDPDYCSGYESSDFEFISETESKKSGIIIRKRGTAISVKQPPKKTFKICSIERLNSDLSAKEYFGNCPEANTLNHYVGFIEECPSGFNNINKPGPTGLNTNSNKQCPSGLINVNHPRPSELNRNVYKQSPSTLNNDNQQCPSSGFNNFNKPVPSDFYNNANKPYPNGFTNVNKPGVGCLSNNQAVLSFFNSNKQLGHSCVNNHPDPSGLTNKQPGPDGLNNSQPGPSGLNNNKNDQLNNKANTEDHVIPEREEFLNLFQGMYERALRPNSYALENKSIYEPNPRIPGMFIEMHGVGFDMAARQNQPYDEDIDEETRAEAMQNRNRILQMYAGENRRKRRR